MSYDKLITLDTLKTAIIKLKALISGKADKATTLSGYGITDGYKKWTGTKAEYDALTSYDDDTVYITTDEDAATYVDSASFQAHLNNKSNPHEVTAAQLGVYTKEETYSKSEVYQKSEVYPKSESYSKTEVDTAIASAAPNITVDATLSETSENPVQNKAVATAIESVQKIYYGTSEPDSSLGKDGDIYIMYKE